MKPWFRYFENRSMPKSNYWGEISENTQNSRYWAYFDFRNIEIKVSYEQNCIAKPFVQVLSYSLRYLTNPPEPCNNCWTLIWARHTNFEKNNDSFILCLVCVDTKAQVKKYFTTKSPPNFQAHFELFCRSVSEFLFALSNIVKVAEISQISGAPFWQISYGCKSEHAKMCGKIRRSLL